MSENLELCRGRKVHRILYGGQVGYVLEFKPGTQPIRHFGIGVSGGGQCDILFKSHDGPSIHRAVPEDIIRGVQWRIYDEILPEPELKALEIEAQDKEAARFREQKRLELESEQRMRIGKILYDQFRSEKAKAIVVAFYERDDSDSQSDYFNTKKDRATFQLLSWSTHTRNLFSEMRKAATGAAKAFPDIAHLAKNDPEAEHRENYSGGGGMYLKKGRTYGDGWVIEKWELNSYRLNDIYELLGRGNYLAADREAFLKAFAEQMGVPTDEDNAAQLTGKALTPDEDDQQPLFM